MAILPSRSKVELCHPDRNPPSHLPTRTYPTYAKSTQFDLGIIKKQCSSFHLLVRFVTILPSHLTHQAASIRMRDADASDRRWMSISMIWILTPGLTT